jgi:hypothetical protein
MPYGRIDQSLYVGQYANVEAINTATLYKPGELGSQFQSANKAYQLIQLDSGATSSTSAGTPVTGHLAFWKNRSTYLVTNDKAQAENPGSGPGASSVAGVFCSLTGGAAGSATITAGNYGVIQQRGTHVGVLSGSNAAVKGDILTSDTSSATAQAQKYTPGTAPAATPVAVATAATGAVTANYTPARIGGWDLVDQP